MNQFRYIKQKLLIKAFGKISGKIWLQDCKDFIAANNLTPVTDGLKEWQQMWSGFGEKPNPLYYTLFCHFIDHDRKYIVPQDVSRHGIEPVLNPREYLFYYCDKNNFDEIFPPHFLPRTILKNIGGDIVYNNTTLHSKFDEQSFKQLLDNTQLTRVIIKPTTHSLGGHGIHFAQKEKDGWFVVGQEKPTPFNLVYLQKNFGKDYIIQEVLQQSDEMAHFNETSINTIRVGMYKSVKTNEWHILGAVVRMGGKGSLVDNVSSGGVSVGISMDGTLDKCGYDREGRRYITHNDIDFSQPHKLQNFDKVKDFAFDVANHIHNLRLLALDIAIDKEGNPRLIEFNCVDFSSKLYQFVGYPAWGEFTEEIIDYCRKNLHKIWYRIRL